MTAAPTAGDYEVERDEEPLPAAGHRTYEVYQRERVGDTTNLIKPIQLISQEYLDDPYPLLEILREQYPCYRDWLGNRFWITRYDDVTSVFADEASFETRSKRWRYGEPELGRDLADELSMLWAVANRVDAALDAAVLRMLDDLAAAERPDLATGFAARLPIELWGEVLALPRSDLPEFASRYWRMQRGAGWDARSQRDGRAAIDELVSYFEPLLAARRADPSDDYISALARLDLDDGPAMATDLVVTLLEADHQTLHGALANLWFLLLTHPGEFEQARSDRLMLKFAYLETLRHSPPVLSAERFARSEVERFGRLLPKGALLYCSAAAANRDPRQFADPDRFVVDRKDLCRREPRGQYRADGLPSGIAFGLGRPSKHPAVPKERPRSRYAIARDVAVRASELLLERWPSVELASGAKPRLRSLRLGEMRTCWQLPVSFTTS